MPRSYLPRPSPGTCVAFVALVAALSGTAVALPGKNSVDSGDIKKGAVRSSDIKNGQVKRGDIRKNAVDSGKVRNGSLRARDFRKGDLPRGPRGVPGPSTGPAGGALSGNYPNPGLAADMNKLVPVAVLNIAADGTLRSEAHRRPVTGRPTVAHAGGSGRYDVTFPGAAFLFSDDAATCTVSDGNAKIVSTNSVDSSKLRIWVFTHAGAVTDGDVHCTVHDLR